MHVSSEMTKANSPIFNIRINARSRVEKWGDFEKPTLTKHYATERCKI